MLGIKMTRRLVIICYFLVSQLLIIHYLCTIMIIYNPTYNVSNDKAVAFIKWLRSRYIPLATESNELKEARLAHLMVTNEDKTNSFSLQFTVENVDVLEKNYGFRLP